MTMARAQLSCCTRLYLLTLPDWQKSKGVREEVRLAVGMGRAVQGFAPTNDCEEVSGIEIFAEFGLPLQKKPQLVLLQRKEEE